MKIRKVFFLMAIVLIFVFSISSSVLANDCSLCGKKNYIGSQCASCTFNKFVNKIEHPCKICGKNIFFGNICKSCRKKIAGSQKIDAVLNKKSPENDDEKNNKINSGRPEKKPSGCAKILNSITTSANKFYRRIFGSNKHD